MQSYRRTMSRTKLFVWYVFNFLLHNRMNKDVAKQHTQKSTYRQKQKYLCTFSAFFMLAVQPIWKEILYGKQTAKLKQLQNR